MRIIETPVASKVHALNLGDDAAASTFPRFYIDADVVLSLESLRQLAAVLTMQHDGARVLATAPRFAMNVRHSSWLVREFYAVNDRMPSSREGIGGSGVYGLSEAGRSRFDRFPQLTADDGFVRLQFSPSERVTVDECVFDGVRPADAVGIDSHRNAEPPGQHGIEAAVPTALDQQPRRPQRPRTEALDKAAGLVGRAGCVPLREDGRAGGLWRRLGSGQAVAWEHNESARVVASVGRTLVGDKQLVSPFPLCRNIQTLRCWRLPPAADTGCNFFGHCPRSSTATWRLSPVNEAYREQVPWHRFYAVNDATRWNKLGLLWLVVRLVLIVLRERPGVIISTDITGYVAMRIGRWLGTQTIRMDGIANVERLSMSGQRIGRHADLWLTQWPHLAETDGPHYAGAVL